MYITSSSVYDEIDLTSRSRRKRSGSVLGILPLLDELKISWISFQRLSLGPPLVWAPNLDPNTYESYPA